MSSGWTKTIRRSPRIVGALAVVLSLAVQAPSLAQETPPTTVVPGAEAEPTNARDWFMRGESQYHVGQYQSAVDAWQHAYALDPRPRIQYNLAQAFERLGRLEDAVAALERFIAGADPDEEVYADASARLVALRQRIASTGVTLHGGPTGGEILIDGQPWGMTPRPDRIPLTPGSHRLEVRYPEQRAFRATFAVPAGQVTDIEITDDAISGHTTSIVEVEARPSHAMLFAGAGMGAAGIIGLAYGIERQVRVSNCGAAGNYCANLTTGETERTIGLAVGGTLTAAGAALVIVDLLRHASYDRRHSAVACAPLLAGATCRLRF